MPFLYRALPDGRYARHDPATDRYDVVPAGKVPRLRLAQPSAGDPAHDFRKMCLLAMVDFQERAHAAGDPEAAAPYLEHLARLAADPAAGRRLARLSWVAAPTSRGTLKAVGEAEHQGRTLYGRRAAAALRAQENRGERRRNGDSAAAILTKVHTTGVTTEDLEQLATHLPALPIERLRHARQILSASFGGAGQKAGMVRALQDHVRKLVESGDVPAADWADPGGGAVGPFPAAPTNRKPPRRPEKLPPAPPGKLFDVGEQAEEPEHARTAHAVADAARWRMPGLNVESPGADATPAEHLDALTAIDRHVRGLGATGQFFTGLAEHVDKVLADHAAGKIDADDVREIAGDFANEEADTDNPSDVADDLRAAGHHDAAKFFQRRARDAFKVAHAALMQAAGPAPESEPEPQTVEELEDRVRAKFAANPDDLVAAFDAATDGVPVALRAEFYQKNGIRPPGTTARSISAAVNAAYAKFGAPADDETAAAPEPVQPETEPASHGMDPLHAYLYQHIGGTPLTQKELMTKAGIGNHSSFNTIRSVDESLAELERRGLIRRGKGVGGKISLDPTNKVDLKGEVPFPHSPTIRPLDERDDEFSPPPVTPTGRGKGKANPLEKAPPGGWTEADKVPGHPLLRQLQDRGKATVGDLTAKVVPHPAGGYMVETMRSRGDGTADREQLPEQHADMEGAQEAAFRHLTAPAPKLVDNVGKTDRLDEQQPGAADERLEGEGGGAEAGRVRPGGVLGGAVPPGAGAAAAGAGEGPGGGPAALRPGARGRRRGPVRADDGRGDAGAGGEGVGARRPAGRDELKTATGANRDETGVRLGGGVAGDQPAIPEPTPAEESVAAPPTPENPTDLSAGNFRYADREFHRGGLKAKFDANLAALRTLREIQAEGRTTATPEEQAILSKWTGWGQFPGVFNEYWDKDFRSQAEAAGIDHREWEEERGKWSEERRAVRALMSDEEWESAKTSTLNAHYTHPDVVDAHWKLAERLGFKGGRFLETSAGIGYYLGMMPPHLAAKTRSNAVEKDPTTGGMLRMLYPSANARVGGFEENVHPDNHYDLVASNVPFGAYKVHDPRYNKHQANIHDYFFLKSADVVRPGGLVMHITSAGTLDKADPKIREELAKTCDLVGAIRFPGGAHKENAGTDVVTDMLVLRKRLPGEEPGDRSWLETTTVPDPDGGEPIPVNAYFAKNPHMVLGRLDRTGTMYRGESMNVSPATPEELAKALGRPVKVAVDDKGKRRFVFDDGTRVPAADIERVGQEAYKRRLDAAVAKMPAGVMTPARAPAKRFAPETLPAPGEVKEGGYHHADGKVYVRSGGGMTAQDLPPAAVAKVADHLGLRDAFRAVINAETAGKDAAAERAELNRVYDAFVKKHGPVNAPANKRAFASDPDAPPLLALEKYDPKTKKAQKADIFTKPVVAPAAKVTKVKDVAEGVGVTLHETGTLDVEHIAKLTGLPKEQVGRQLAEQGLGYEDPSDGWQPADHYLSGNVRRKLALARAAAAGDPRYAPNVAALEKVQPEDVHHDDIEVRLGAAWVPPADVTEFAAGLLNADPEALTIRYAPNSGEWKAEYNGRKGDWAKNSRTAKQVWGAGGQNFIAILNAALNNRQIVVKKGDPNDPDKLVLDEEATRAAAQKVQELKDHFKGWVWTDDARRIRLHRYYNDNFNNIRNIQYDGSLLKLPGKNPAIELRPHQKNFVWQVVTTGNGLAGHEVGTGKTYTMVAAAMELRRLGLARKPAVVCKKANVDAITADALKLYPGAKILSTADMFDAKSRKQTISRIATGDYDMVIMTHDHMDLLGMRPETQRKYLQEELAELDAAHAEAVKEAGPKAKSDRVVKQLAKARENLQAKIKEALDATSKDDAVHFEDLGVDQLFVDEAHRYKTLPVYSKMGRVKGVPNSRSKRATNMLMRTRWLQEQNGGRGVVFATGTPVANTMGELYNMQRYLQPKELEERGLKTFDAWASTFGDVTTAMEKTATGAYKAVSRFSKFVNIPELMQISRQMLDVQRADDLRNTDEFGTEAEALRHARGLMRVQPAGTPTADQLAAERITVTPKDGGGYTVASPSIVRPARKDAVTVAPKSAGVDRLMRSLQERAEKLKGTKPGESDDNMLSIFNDGRKGAVDLRLVYADAPDDPDSKSNQMVANVLKIAKENPGKTQMIFADLARTNELKAMGETNVEPEDDEDEDGAGGESAGKTAGGFDLFADVVAKLVKGGIPREKILDFRTLADKKKEEAIERLRTGDALVAIGGTETLGTGVNAQHKLLALHHIDCPWRPSDLEQRDGRGWRHGNENKQVQIHRYVTEGSLDELMWQAVGRKAAAIKQVMTTEANTDRSVEEVDTEELSPEAIMAAASGDMRILEKVQVDEDVKNLKAAHLRHEREQATFRDVVRQGEPAADAHREKIAAYRETAEHLDRTPEFHMDIGGRRYTERKDAAEALEAAIKDAPGYYEHRVATYRGLPVVKSQGKYYLRTLDGRHSQEVAPSVASLDAKARQTRAALAAAEGDLAQHTKDLEQIRAKVGKSFPKAADLAAKLERQKYLEKALSGRLLPAGYAEGDAVTLTDGRAVTLVDVGDGGKIQVTLEDGTAEAVDPALVPPKDAAPAPPARAAAGGLSVAEAERISGQVRKLQGTAPEERPRPKADQEADLLRAAAADPAKWDDLARDAALPEIDRAKLLAAVEQLYGGGVHAEAKKKSKAGIIDLLRGQRPL